LDVDALPDADLPRRFSEVELELELESESCALIELAVGADGAEGTSEPDATEMVELDGAWLLLMEYGDKVEDCERGREGDGDD
jgi:hypothetical protein